MHIAFVRRCSIDSCISLSDDSSAVWDVRERREERRGRQREKRVKNRGTDNQLIALRRLPIDSRVDGAHQSIDGDGMHATHAAA